MNEILKESLLGIGISDEKIDEIGKLIKNVIPYERFQEKIKEIEGLKSQILTRDNQLNDLLKTNKDNEELSKQLNDLKEHNKKEKATFDETINKLKLNNAVDLELIKSDVKDLVVAKNLFNLENITFNDKMELNGFNEQLTSIKQNYPYLFKEKNIDIKGATPITPNNNDKISTSGIKSYDEILAGFQTK